MQKIKDIEGLKAEVRKGLRKYLEVKGTQFSSNGQQFNCPNRAFHENNDIHFSCGFWPDEEHWKCFACNLKGDIFDAAHYLEDKPSSGSEWISKTLIYLADLMGVSYDYEELTPEERLRQRVYEVLAIAASLAHTGLSKSELAMNYIRKRGWQEVAGEFKLGYCSYDKLIDALGKRGFETEVLSRAGLIHRELFDRRLLFPVHDSRGRVVGFASRAIDDRPSPDFRKYENSSTSMVYQKSETIYNLNHIAGDSAIVVEGFADVLTMCRRGIKNAVAICGISMTDNHLKALIKKGIKKIAFCLDTDKSGQVGEEAIISRITSAHDLEISIRQRDECKDPDECLNKHDFLLTSNNVSLFDFYVAAYKATSNKIDRDRALRSILLEKSPIDRENLCKKMAKELSVRMDVVLQEFDHIVEKEGDEGLVSAADVIREKSTLDREIVEFEKSAWRREELLGLSCGFPIFTEKMDGLQPQVYLFGGVEGTGKSAFTRNLCFQVIKANPGKAFVLFVSIDEPVSEVIARLLAMETGLEINAMKNPKYKIQANNAYSSQEKEELLGRYNDALKTLRNMSHSIAIKDETHIRDIRDIKRLIGMYKQIAEGRHLIVCIDSAHRVRVPQRFGSGMREAAIEISDALKSWRNDYGVTILSTVELRKHGNGRPIADDIKEASDFKYDADCVGLMYNDIAICQEAAKLRFEFGGAWQPVVEINFTKNRTSSFKGRMYYKFYTDFHRMVECTAEEMQMYHRLAFPVTMPEIGVPA